ncbi:hypothetical protein DFQ27_007909 [Actinomortierella ambigua]|uniref:Uncharacterized protein n=1 Tax=Actinomortierella ambigua TaxID=1343610 RepID=A0A9P6UBT3_9FUNG|nr:hypothetical protein DFQ27_007909 [Actinomortierella ambigua]
MLVSVAVGASSRAKTYCKYLADTAQATIPLRETPDESNSTIVIPGGVVMKMVSELEDTLEYDTIYEFKAIYRDCKPSPAFFVDEIKVGPYSLKDSKIAFYNKGLLFGVDGDLAWIYTQLLWYNRDSNVAGGFNFISRSGVEIEDGKWVQECYTTRFW